MGRWEPGARERLESAALDLFEEQGFAAATVPEITARAGLTTRTFFRYFADKREVLFGDDDVSGLVTGYVAEAPAVLPPAELVVDCLERLARDCFEGRKGDLRRRRAIVDSDEGLRERNLHKRAAVRDSFARELAGRGLPAVEATLCAEIGVLALFTAIEAWLDADDDRTLVGLVLECLESLNGVVAGFAAAASES